MPTHYHDDEYTGSEHATDVFKAPTPELTEEEKKQKRDMEEGRYLENPEQEDLSQQVNYSTMEENYARERRPGFDREMEAIGKAKQAGNLTDQELIEAHKRAKRIRDAEDEIDPQTGWPMYLLKGAGWLLNKVGEGFDWVDKQAGIPGTDIDVYHARRKILDPLSETHLALGILGEIFLPDSIDIATAGFSYIPNRFRKAGKVGIKLWADLTKARKGAEFKAAKADWDSALDLKGAEFAAKAEGRPYEKFLTEEGIVMALSKENPNIPKGTGESLSKHYKDKLAVHERALNSDMIGFDQRALDRRAQIDAQFELNKEGLPQGPRPIKAGSTETARRAKAAWSLGEEVDAKTIKVFEESNQSILDGYNYYLWGSKINVGKTQAHHKGVVRQIFEASNGLNKKYRIESAKYMQNRIGFELGYHGRNATPVPERFHPRVHAIINSRISSSPDLFNVEGAARELGFPKNWQSVLTFEERKPLYNEIADAIRESVDAINIHWEVLLSRSDDLTTWSKEEYLDLMLRHNKIDEKLRQIASPRLMASRKNWDLKDTSTAVLNEILSKSNKKDLMLPFVGKVESDMAPIVRKVLNEENGWNLFREMILTDKSSATILKANPKIKLTVAQRTSLDNYVQDIKNIRRGSTPGNIGRIDYDIPDSKGLE